MQHITPSPLRMVRAIRWANAEESGTLLIDDNCDVARLFFMMLTDADTWHFTYVPVFSWRP